jgi:hypothetical protein
MGESEMWELRTLAGDRRVGWFGFSTQVNAESWYTRELTMPYRPPFYMRGMSSGVEIRPGEEG